MNILPLLLAAVAVLLAAGAFAKAMSASKPSRDPEAGSRDEALRALLGDLATRVAAIQGSVSHLPDAVSGLRSDLAGLPAALDGQTALLRDQLEASRALPAQIARETSSTQLLEQVRALREAGGAAVDRLSSIQIEVQSSSASRDEHLRRLAESVASVEASLGRNPSDGADASARLSEAVREGSEKAVASAREQARAIEALSAGLAVLPGLVESIGSSLGALDHGAVLATQSATLEQARAALADQTSILEGTREAVESLVSLFHSAEQARAAQDAAVQERRGRREALDAGARESQDRLLERVGAVGSELASIHEAISALPVRTAEEIAMRPAPAPELEELAIAVREAGSLRGDSVRSVADAVSRVAERLEASAEDGRAAREDAADRLSQSLSTLEAVSSGVREALLPLGEALRGHGDAVVPVVKGLETAQDRLEEAAVSLRANQVEFAASVGVFTSAAQELSTGLGAFAREGAEDASRDPAAVQQALLEALERLLGGFSESLRATLVEADLRHREALAEIAARLPGSLA